MRRPARPRRSAVGRSRRPAPLGIEPLHSRAVLAPLAPLVALRNDTGTSAADRITCDGALTVEASPGATIAYSTRPGVWTTTAPLPHEGVNSVSVRQIDPLLGASPARRIVFTVDTVAPREPTVSAVSATGKKAPDDAVPADGALVVRHESGTDAFVTAVDGTAVLIPVTAKAGTSIAVAELATAPGPHTIEVTAFDVAGNSASVVRSVTVRTPSSATQASTPKAVAAPQSPPQPVLPKSNPYVINVREYGAVGDDVTDDSAAINAAWQAATLTGQPLYFPTGKYNVGTGQLLLSLENCRFTGLTVYGDGIGRSIIDCMQVTSSPQMIVTCPTTPGDSVFLSMKGIGVFTKTPGTGVQFGARRFTDPINEPEIDLMVLNFDRAATAVAVEINYVLNGEIRLVANTTGPGTSLLLRQASFNHFTGSYGGVGGVSVRMADGYNAGNVFTSLDMENVATCVVSSSPYNLGNTFVGGTWSYSRNGVVSTGGRKLVIINPQLNPALGAKAPAFVGAAVGLVLWPPPPLL